MKLKKETATKFAVKKSGPAGIGSPVLSALQIAPAKPLDLSAEAPASKPLRIAKPIKITSSTANSKHPPLTTIHAKIDVGFGNMLFIRGHGNGLSWDKGLALECLDATTWVWSTKKANNKIEFKLLLNDQIWAQGENLSVAPGEVIETVPAFN